MKKIILLFAGAIASFLLFSYIDEYENLILPLFFASRTEDPLTVTAPSGKELTPELEDSIKAFNNALSRAYLYSDPSLLTAAPVDKSLLPSIVQEISYLEREGKILDMRVIDVKIEKLEVFSPFAVQIETRDTVEVSYLNLSDRAKSATYPPAVYSMRYVLQRAVKGWQVNVFETVSVEEQKL